MIEQQTPWREPACRQMYEQSIAAATAQMQAEQAAAVRTLLPLAGALDCPKCHGHGAYFQVQQFPVYQWRVKRCDCVEILGIR